MNFAITLEPFAETHLRLLSTWLRRPHVMPWYPEPEDNVAWASSPPPGGSHALIAVGTVPVGYMRWQIVDRETLDSVGLVDVPASSVDVDLLLGEAGYAGQGVGPAALGLLVTRLRADPELPLVGLTTSVANTHAHSAFERAGFRVMRQYAPAGFGLCHRYVLPLRQA